MNALKYAVLGLAAARLTRLVVHDEITEGLRDRIARAAGEAEYAPPPARNLVPNALDKLDTLVTCDYCSSVWAGAAVLVAEQLGPVGRFAVRTLALSQAALTVKALIDKVERS